MSLVGVRMIPPTDAGSTVDDVEQHRQPVRQVRRADQQGARALAVAVVHQPELALAQRDRAPALRTAPESAASRAPGNVRSSSVLAIGGDQAVETPRANELVR